MFVAFRSKSQSILTSLREKVKLPDKYKGTVIEKWAKYWESLLNDYGDVVRDTVKDAQVRPVRYASYAALGSVLFYASSINPTDIDFRNRIVEYQNDFGLVGTSVRNPNAQSHLKFLENAFNYNLIRRFSFGIFSIIWVDNFDPSLGIYKAQCDYLKPKLLTFHNRIIDIGFWNKYWILEQKMVDYDVNPNEWIDFAKTEYEYRHKKPLLQ